MKRKLFEVLASSIEARAHCVKSGNTEWFWKHGETAEQLTADHMPSGSGVDSGTTIDLDKSTADKIVFHTSYHHMNDGGYYDGWTEHDVIVTPSLASGFNIKVTGRDRNGIKDYLGDLFYESLVSEVDW
jgi:hypothetical protein